jgi:hypothetical protein
MSVKELLWIDELAARDWHLLAGYASPQFNQLITIKDTRGERRGDKPHAPDDIFFVIDPPINGVTVDPTTGEVRVTGDTFLLATALLPQSTTLACVAKDDTSIFAEVRIRVHLGFAQLSLSPAKLTVRKGAKAVRYTVIGVFTDGERGDLSNWSPRKSQPRDPGDKSFVRLATGTAVETKPALGFDILVNPIGIAVDAESGFIDCTRGEVKARSS